MLSVIDLEFSFPHFKTLISSKPNFLVSPNLISILEVLAVILSKPRILTTTLLFFIFFLFFFFRIFD